MMTVLITKTANIDTILLIIDVIMFRLACWVLVAISISPYHLFFLTLKVVSGRDQLLRGLKAPYDEYKDREYLVFFRKYPFYILQSPRIIRTEMIHQQKQFLIEGQRLLQQRSASFFQLI